MKYISKTGNECEVIGKTTERLTATKVNTVLECKITKGVTTATGLIFRINESQFTKDWTKL
jgi:hypothetical protein